MGASPTLPQHFGAFVPEMLYWVEVAAPAMTHSSLMRERRTAIWAVNEPLLIAVGVGRGRAGAGALR
ncbi:hypothetical protein LSCM4_03239 [Leishmania orientalis]|uniref:Uncharacterized protein n=1 Tax=Leishmania orientalis TaxID=2249476 RepID=A0A836FYJ3_9TRYP|nr:hypothetical protein LSCM4_03239 [Leishmania orientalis]